MFGALPLDREQFRAISSINAHGVREKSVRNLRDTMHF